MASGWASQDYCPDRKVSGCVVAHVTYPDEFEIAPVRSEDVIASQAGGGALSDLCPSFHFSKPAALSGVMDQVNKIKLHNYVCHTLSL